MTPTTAAPEESDEEGTTPCKNTEAVADQADETPVQPVETAPSRRKARRLLRNKPPIRTCTGCGRKAPQSELLRSRPSAAS